MATEVLMPQMGESIAEGTITRWLIEVGQTVERDQPLLEISTDKVDAEIPAPASGVLLEVLRREGETVPVNETVGWIGQAGEKTAEGGDAPAAATADPAVAAASPEVDVAEATDDDGEMTLEQRIRRFSSPLVRSIAEKEGVDLARISGTGIHSRVTKGDILAHLEQRAAGTLPAAAATTAPPPPSAPPPAAGRGAVLSVYSPPPAYSASENVTIEPMSRIRRLTAEHMVFSKATSAHVSTVFHIDMTRIDNLRRRAKGNFLKKVGTKLTYMPFIFRAVCQGIRQVPQMNAAIDGGNIVYKNDINLGMAVALDNGLIVPVIKRADELSVVGLARAANDLADRARSKKLKPEEAQGGTFTITNPGVFGSLLGTPIISQPQVAILGIGAIEKRPIVVTDEDGNDSLAIRTMSYFTITFDHRLIDGSDADHFMVAVKETLQDDTWDEIQAYI